MTTQTTQVVTEEDLKKSLEALLTPVPKTDPIAPAPTIQVIDLKKSIDTVKEKGSEGLKKALEISDVMNEFTSLIGAHVDHSLEMMQKSLAASMNRDLSFVKLFGDLKKSIEDLGTDVKKFGETTAAAPKTVPATEILNKSISASPIDLTKLTADQSQVLRRQVTTGLEMLAKSFSPGTSENTHYMNAAIRYETSGQINDTDLAAAQQKYAGK